MMQVVKLFPISVILKLIVRSNYLSLLKFGGTISNEYNSFKACQVGSFKLETPTSLNLSFKPISTSKKNEAQTSAEP